jgi:hypothetical protein
VINPWHLESAIGYTEREDDGAGANGDATLKAEGM